MKSFKSQFSKALTEADYKLLQNRLQPVCQRTLRRQVLEYIKYTKRIAICEEYYPTDTEQKLYEEVSEYLQRPKLYALPNSQRQLMTLILRKLLASSTYAIYGTLCGLVGRLEEMLKQQDVDLEIDPESIDYEALDENLDYWLNDEEDTNTVAEPMAEYLHPSEVDNIRKELEDLKEFQNLAAKIKRNSKAEHLFLALEKGFEELEKLGANKKALLFTESRRTQDFLFELLERKGYKGKVVLFNGTNSDRQSTAIYKAWLEKHKGSNNVTGSAAADRRAAIVEHFRDQATIMIATEAAAEGINLQFCSLVVNYDMPWNPQRIEQRIGRCHRYGQKHDVVVINFLNKRNAADVRVYELLNEKFQLFDGVFGSSDEVLGSIGNGVDFEKRITQIYNECRNTNEIERAFDQLQAELHAEISDKMLQARSTLLENFDESVSEKLRVNLAVSLQHLNLFERRLWELTKFALSGRGTFHDDSYRFELGSRERYCMVIPAEGEKKSSIALPEHTQIYRVGHPLAQSILKQYQEIVLAPREVTFDYSGTPVKVALLETLVGQSGWMQVEKTSIESFEQEDHLLISCFTDEGEVVYPEVAGRMFSLNASEGSLVEPDIDIRETLARQLESTREVLLAESAQRNHLFFEQEMDKLDSWAEDMKLGLEKEIADLDGEIKLRKVEAKKMILLEEKVHAQRLVKELEKRRSEKRRNLFEAQDEVDGKKEALLDEVEKLLKQRVRQERLFIVRWKME